MMTGPTPEQVATRVAMIRRQRPEARAIGIALPGAWLGGTELRVNGETLPVVCCASVLQVREALVSQANDGPPLVILTSVPDSELGLDVLARLAGRRLHHIDRWQMVRDLFRARHLDPRLSSQGWVAEALLQSIPEGGYPPVASGLLDMDTVWTHLCRQHLGLPDGRPDAVTLITWSLSAENLHRYERLGEEFRQGLRQRLVDTAGAVGGACLDALEAGAGAWLLPIGLVCEILCSPEARHQIGMAQARARLEPYMGGRSLSSEVGRMWFRAATSVLAALPEAHARDWLDRTEQLLADLKAAEFSGLSSVLPAGFHRRLSQFARTLQQVLQGEAPLDQLEASVDQAQDHREAAQQPERLERVVMALRLARYLATTERDARPTSLAQASRTYVEHGSYADWARRSLIEGDELHELAAAFRALSERIRRVREQHNHRFASLLTTWYRAPLADESLLPIEQALSSLVAEVAALTPILLLVIDGMSYAVFRELSDDLRSHGWLEFTNRPGCAPPSLVSTIPTVTDISRASLLTGKLARGNSAAEKQGFATHAALRGVSRAGHPPVLFHKGDLVESGASTLSEAVRTALRDRHRRVVGVVLNAVDDHLAKSDQLRLAWTIGQFQHLDALLYEAQLARRAIILTSDHGHVLEEGVSRFVHGEEERWRAVTSALVDGEMIVEGPRVAAVTAIPRIVVPWSETIRYAPKKQGYHGGVTPQEVLVPMRVFARREWPLKGWEVHPEPKPTWWNHSAMMPSEAPVPVSKAAPRRSAPVEVQDSLFEEPVVRGEADSDTAWIDRLLSSTLFKAQRQMAGRRAPDNSVVKAVLRALDQHHGRISRPTLARELGQLGFRRGDLLAGLQRLLNVDGYQIVAIDETSGMIELNRHLLNQQFQLS